MSLFANVSNKLVQKMLVKLLLSIVADTQGPAKKSVQPFEKVQKLIAQEPTFITANPAGPDGKGNIEVAATAAGIEAAKDAPAVAPRVVSSASVPDGGFMQFGTGVIPVPEARQRGIKGEVYPFKGLEVGASFFVPATAERPDPAKSLGGTIASAQRRFATKLDTKHSTKGGKEVNDFQLTRKFMAQPVTAEQMTAFTQGKVTVGGALVFRTA